MKEDTNSSYLHLPENLPAPKDDGAADHLTGMRMPSITLRCTSGEEVSLDQLPRRTILFVYPMTGVPGVALPEGWDDLPGARGCTPQACAYRDNYEKILNYAEAVYGLSNQNTEYQSEFKERVHLPYHLLSDVFEKARKALNLPWFELHGHEYLKRLTLIVESGVIRKVHYPVFPSNQDVDWAIQELSHQK